MGRQGREGGSGSGSDGGGVGGGGGGDGGGDGGGGTIILAHTYKERKEKKERWHWLQ